MPLLKGGARISWQKVLMVRRHIYFKLMLRTYSEQERKEEAMDAAAYSRSRRRCSLQKRKWTGLLLL
jgi:hypothetical protein